MHQVEKNYNIFVNISNTDKNESTNTKSYFFRSINDDRFGGFLIWFQHVPAIAIQFVDNHSRQYFLETYISFKC